MSQERHRTAQTFFLQGISGLLLFTVETSRISNSCDYLSTLYKAEYPLQRGPKDTLQIKHMTNCSKKSEPRTCVAMPAAGASTASFALHPPHLLIWFTAILPLHWLTYYKHIWTYSCTLGCTVNSAPSDWFRDGNMLIWEGKNHKAGKEQLASLKDKGEALLRHFSCLIYAVDIFLCLIAPFQSNVS